MGAFCGIQLIPCSMEYVYMYYLCIAWHRATGLTHQTFMRSPAIPEICAWLTSVDIIDELHPRTACFIQKYLRSDSTVV